MTNKTLTQIKKGKNNYYISKKDLRSYIKLNEERMENGICEGCFKKTINLILEKQGDLK